MPMTTRERQNRRVIAQRYLLALEDYIDALGSGETPVWTLEQIAQSLERETKALG